MTQEMSKEGWDDCEVPTIIRMNASKHPRVTIGYMKEWKLLPGKRRGWWSSRKFDRRVRMRALVKGAVNDERTKILLDMGANISAIVSRLQNNYD